MPTPERLVRLHIEVRLAQCGQIVQSQAVMNLRTGRDIAEMANRLDPDVTAAESVKDLRATLEQFRKIAENVRRR